MTPPNSLTTKGTVFTRQFVVTDTVYHGFIEIFNDRNPFHVDDDAARSRGFAAKIMHGNILCGFLSYFIGECLPIKSVIIQSQEIQFHKPVYLNDPITFHAKVSDYFESVKTTELHFYFMNQHNIKVAKGRVRIGLL